jgi:hypothetical protein
LATERALHDCVSEFIPIIHFEDEVYNYFDYIDEILHLWRKDNLHDSPPHPHKKFLLQCQSYIQAHNCSADVDIDHEVVESGEFIKITFTFADRNISVDFVVVGLARQTHSGERMEMQLLGILLLFFHRLTF